MMQMHGFPPLYNIIQKHLEIVSLDSLAFWQDDDNQKKKNKDSFSAFFHAPSSTALFLKWVTLA